MDTTNPTDPVLIVDDEEEFLRGASLALRTSGLGNVSICNDSRKVVALLSGCAHSAVVLDILMPHLTGRELLPEIVQAHPGLPVIMHTAVNEVEVAVECMRNGAFDYLVKPADKTRLVTTIRRAIEHHLMQCENQNLAEQLLEVAQPANEAYRTIVSRSPRMHAILKYIDAVAGTGMPILITGETGTGKELIARAIHQVSGRTGRFIAVNAAGLDDTMLSDSLFGHERGAFTGANARREGLIATANDGTLFLDEIGDLRTETQVKLLRLLEDGSYYPLGSDATHFSTARIVVATNADLGSMMKDGRFRSDLYYRLKTHLIKLPPLKDRREDIPLLVELFIEQAAIECKKKKPTVPRELSIILANYDFPGNIRELKAMLFDAVSRHRSGILSLDTFRDLLVGGDTGGSPTATERLAFPDHLPTLEQAENALIHEALDRSQGNQAIAAGLLGLSRAALNKRLVRAKGKTTTG